METTLNSINEYYYNSPENIEYKLPKNIDDETISIAKS